MKIVAAAAALVLVAAAPAGDRWTRAWTASMWQAPADQVKTLDNVTIRSAVRVGVGGGQLRLRLANDYGSALTIGAATLRLPGGRAVRVTFDGQGSVRVPEGAPLVSDPVALPVKAFDVVEVSLFFPEAAQPNTVHDVVGEQTLISQPGDHTDEDFVPAEKWRLRPLIAGLDVQSDRPRPLVIAFGDSITDNVGCANDAMPRCRWGDVLGRRLAAAGKPHVVVTQAISGNRILAHGTGPSALARFDRDVLAVPGVSHVVLLEGINDIGNSGREANGVARPTITADQLIAGYKQLALRAHARGIKIYAMTILPYVGAGYQTPAGEAMRVKVNDWIRSAKAFDAVIDMEKVVADPANPTRLAAELQGGDNLHPDGRGETRMGEAIDLGLFK
ncbi:SGNH/GDSL hydrolase family protein [Sphingomonas sp. DG1-23]|uniref:SGNH/GDSL hydrolase family protein n=1 Tax=Sphingomonas sp. DG1-23 TaxID=3068316 RepID=UPI00273D9257|nr:SGNH/GDSL hydrolase family protein [Sphingomonas sp. DG1-23]MDP5278123.1 SGNH/GDSL hydrolase family protein [Sphingomonas sp. DG1-23]